MVKKLLTICFIVLFCTSLTFGRNNKPIDPQTTQISLLSRQNQSGPTIFLDLDKKQPRENSAKAFMYFVPLIAPVQVQSEISTNNQQKTSITSVRRERDKNSFEAECEFVMTGSGYQKNIFDPAQIIEKTLEDVKKPKSLKNIIDYIEFDGQGTGRVKIKGTISDGIEKVNSVKIVFNANGYKSPVTVGLYDVHNQQGQYKYENRHSQKVARVNSLTFKSGQAQPRMSLTLAAISNQGKKEGFCSRLKGKIANLFIKPLKVDAVGNEAMLDFGYALYSKHASFTFPRARNLKNAKPEKAKETIVAKGSKKYSVIESETN